MPAEVNDIKIEYRLNHVEEVEIYLPRYHEMDGFDVNLFSFGFVLDYLWDLEHHIFSVVITVIYEYEGEEQNKKWLEYTGEIGYCVKDLPQFIDADSQINLPEDFLSIITGIAISTIRGMIKIRTLGKVQGKVQIPIVDPNSMVKEYLINLSNNNKTTN